MFRFAPPAPKVPGSESKPHLKVRLFGVILKKGVPGVKMWVCVRAHGLLRALDGRKVPALALAVLLRLGKPQLRSGGEITCTARFSEQSTYVYWVVPTVHFVRGESLCTTPKAGETGYQPSA